MKSGSVASLRLKGTHDRASASCKAVSIRTRAIRVMGIDERSCWAIPSTRKKAKAASERKIG